MMIKNKKINKKTVVIVLLSLLLLISLVYIIYSEFFAESDYISYLQNKDEVYKMECGIIKNCEKFR